MSRPLKIRHRKTVGAAQWRVALLLGFTVVCSAAIKGEPQARVRVIPYGIDVSLANRLLPNDEVVVVHRDFDSAEPSRNATAAEAVSDAVQRADLVAVVDVTDVEGVLVEDGTWIRTRLVGTVNEILRSSNDGRFSVRQRLTVDITGGELRIGRILVKTDIVHQLPANRQYLWFMSSTRGFAGEDGASIVPASVNTPHLIENGRLGDTWPRDQPRKTPNLDPLHGLTLREVARLVRGAQ